MACNDNDLRQKDDKFLSQEIKNANSGHSGNNAVAFLAACTYFIVIYGPFRTSEIGVQINSDLRFIIYDLRLYSFICGCNRQSQI
jgi:hypothetical protein